MLRTHPLIDVALIGLVTLASSAVDPPSPQPTPQPATTPATIPATTTATPTLPPFPTTTPAPAQTVQHLPRMGACTWTATRASESPKDDPDAATLGHLVYSRVDVRCEDVSLRDAVRALGEVLDINIVARYESTFEADTAVNLDLRDVDGRTALEAMISQSSGDATWQLRRGLVEVGLRSFLARPSARRTHAYDVTSLTLEAPYYVHPSIGLTTNGQSPFVEPDPELTKRRTPTEVAADIVQNIANQVEPEAWQPIPPGDGTSGTAGPQPMLAGNSNRNASGGADRNFDPIAGPVFVRGKWAQIDYNRPLGVLVVTASDFIHRGIAGYPAPLPPVDRQPRQ